MYQIQRNLSPASLIFGKSLCEPIHLILDPVSFDRLDFLSARVFGAG